MLSNYFSCRGSTDKITRYFISLHIYIFIDIMNSLNRFYLFTYLRFINFQLSSNYSNILRIKEMYYIYYYVHEQNYM